MLNNRIPRYLEIQMSTTLQKWKKKKKKKRRHVAIFKEEKKGGNKLNKWAFNAPKLIVFLPWFMYMAGPYEFYSFFCLVWCIYMWFNWSLAVEKKYI